MGVHTNACGHGYPHRCMCCTRYAQTSPLKHLDTHRKRHKSALSLTDAHPHSIHTRTLFVRCEPSLASNYYCAAELDNPGLTCVPLTQDRIAGLSTYYGPTDTCEARRMRMPGPHAPCCARCCGGLACCAACALCVRALHARAHVCMCVCSSLERRIES